EHEPGEGAGPTEHARLPREHGRPIAMAHQQGGGDQAHQPEAGAQVQPARRDAEGGHRGARGETEPPVSRITMMTISTPAARARRPARRAAISGLALSARAGPPWSAHAVAARRSRAAFMGGLIIMSPCAPSSSTPATPCCE